MEPRQIVNLKLCIDPLGKQLRPRRSLIALTYDDNSQNTVRLFSEDLALIFKSNKKNLRIFNHGEENYVLEGFSDSIFGSRYYREILAKKEVLKFFNESAALIDTKINRQTHQETKATVSEVKPPKTEENVTQHLKQAGLFAIKAVAVTSAAYVVYRGLTR